MLQVGNQSVHFWYNTNPTQATQLRIPTIAHLPKLPAAYNTKSRQPPGDSTHSAQPNLLDSLLFGATKERPFQPSIDLNPFVYCALIDTLPLGCMSESLLDLWNHDAERIRRLTVDDIRDTLNRTTVNPVTGHDTDFTHLLGDVRRNASGHIVGAGALLTHWMVYVNFTAVDHKKIGNLAGTEDWVWW